MCAVPDRVQVPRVRGNERFRIAALVHLLALSTETRLH
jgi:hypothetical protein